MAASSIAPSLTPQLIGPVWPRMPAALGGQLATTPKLGFSPKQPPKLAGMRIEPAASLPTASVPTPAARCAAAPMEEPEQP